MRVCSTLPWEAENQGDCDERIECEVPFRKLFTIVQFRNICREKNPGYFADYCGSCVHFYRCILGWGICDEWVHLAP